jgi:hypothetical protein
MLGRLLASVMLLALTLGCGCRGERASSAEQDRSLQTAKRWRPAGRPGNSKAVGRIDNPSYQEPRIDNSSYGGARPGDAKVPAAVDASAPAEKAVKTEQEGQGIHGGPMNRAAASLKPAGAIKENGPGEEGPERKPAEGPGVITLDTGDCDEWPSYDMPSVIEIEVPELPEKIRRGNEGVTR